MSTLWTHIKTEFINESNLAFEFFFSFSKGNYIKRVKLLWNNYLLEKKTFNNHNLNLLKLKSFNVLRLKQYFNLFLFTVQYIKYTMTFWMYIKILIVWWIYWHVNIFLLQGFKFYISIKLLSSTYLFIYSINFQNTVWYFNITSGALSN